MNISTHHRELNRCAIAYAAVFLERQEVLTERFGAFERYEADLGRPSITFGQTELRIAMLGSSSSNDDTWLWGWANPSLPQQAPGLLEPSLWLREQTDAYQIPELATDSFTLADLPDYGMGLGSTVAMAAVGLIGARGLYAMPYPAGQVFVAIMDEQVELPVADPRTFARRIGSGCTLVGADHRLILQTYCNVHRLATESTADGAVKVQFANGSQYVVAFDEQDRITSMEGNL